MQDARFLLDRSVGGRILIARLRSAGWDARTLAEQYGDERAQRMRDEEWIAEGTRSGFVLLAKDHRVATVRWKRTRSPSTTHGSSPSLEAS